ncbi:NUDIX hydrolase [Deinococcus radiopugnans]|uniref:8-oxo-dGTP pyrophosphatase MutT (NUDIX family) n=1 Tax=Deinococcus radiopugnans ATCC 19172 TaxID=585398 RepID=A0A5C4Y1V3_9DEIO|nr:NUDIX domain-containing protein [Deinococcus radiopugnans]MBB6017889.1 8-oxo-dGTP pyrophosphatase MutT (NUDIX family) [Deinococcus radiopugnans ATCC 19172]TNM68952.1 NUDIX domain-containing protein [Deinococcus radiopugnans ATCC 19172]
MNSPETFAIPCVGAIIPRGVGGVRCLLIQERRKPGVGIENGMLEVAAGKVRAYENVFDALRREVAEETGLRLTRIGGEETALTRTVNGYAVMSYTPFCTTQNLSGGYSIILHSFLCEAEGELLAQTDETRNLRWLSLDECRTRLQTRPEEFYPLHINALSLYLGQEKP